MQTLIFNFKVYTSLLNMYLHNCNQITKHDRSSKNQFSLFGSFWWIFHHTFLGCIYKVFDIFLFCPPSKLQKGVTEWPRSISMYYRRFWMILTSTFTWCIKILNILFIYDWQHCCQGKQNWWQRNVSMTKNGHTKFQVEWTTHFRDIVCWCFKQLRVKTGF